MDEDGGSAAQALRRIAKYLDVPIESLFGLPVHAVPRRGRRVPTADVHELLLAFSQLDDVGARKRVIEAAAAEVKARQDRTRARKP